MLQLNSVLLRPYCKQDVSAFRQAQYDIQTVSLSLAKAKLSTVPHKMFNMS